MRINNVTSYWGVNVGILTTGLMFSGATYKLTHNFFASLWVGLGVALFLATISLISVLVGECVRNK